MRPLCKENGYPPNRDRRRIGCRWWFPAMLGFVLSALSGCQKQAPSSSPPTIQRNTPQAKLEWVAKRLQRAFELGKPSRLAGIRVLHTMNYQLKEPKEPAGLFQATVVIVTKTETTFLPKNKRRGKASQDSKSKMVDSALKSAGILDQTKSLPGTKHSALAEGKSISGSRPQNTRFRTQEIPAEKYSIQEQQSFELVYRNDRWQLVQALDSDPERLWFQYALEE